MQYAPNAKKIHEPLQLTKMVIFKNDGFGKIEICAIPQNIFLTVNPEVQRLITHFAVSIGCGGWLKIDQEKFDDICENDLM